MIAVTSTTRPGGVDYLASTLTQINEQAPTSTRLLVLHGDCRPPKEAASWRVVFVSNTDTKSNFAPVKVAIEQAETLGEDLVLLEDDIHIAPGGVKYMEVFHVPQDLVLITFHECIFGGAFTPCGLFRGPGATFIMAQALKIPARSYDLLLRAPAIQKNPHALTDEALANVLRGQQIGYHVPAAVQHIGKVSAIRRPGHLFHQTKTFAGDSGSMLDILQQPQYKELFS